MRGKRTTRKASSTRGSETEATRPTAASITEEDEEASESDDASSWFERWHVAVSAREVRRRMPKDCDVDRLLTDFPNILAMDVPALFEDLRAVFPTRDPADVLRTNPKIATQVRSRQKRVFFPFFSRRRKKKSLSRFRRGAHLSRVRPDTTPRSWRETRHPRGLCASLDRSPRSTLSDAAPVFRGGERQTSHTRR